MRIKFVAITIFLAVFFFMAAAVVSAAEVMPASKLTSLNLREVKTISVIANGDSIKVTYRPLYGVVVDDVVTQVFYGREDAMRYVIDHRLYGATVKSLKRDAE